MENLRGEKMNRNAFRPRRVTAVLAVLGVTVLALTPAVAEPPPPPDFLDFTVRNASMEDAVNIKVDIWQAQQDFTVLPMQPTDTFPITSLPAGQSTPLPVAGKFGVAKIRCRVECPQGHVVANVEITATQQDFDPSKPGDEYAGFTPAHPKNKQFPIGVEILPPAAPGGHLRVRLFAYERWGAFWGAKEAVKDLP